MLSMVRLDRGGDTKGHDGRGGIDVGIVPTPGQGDLRIFIRPQVISDRLSMQHISSRKAPQCTDLKYPLV